MKKVEEFIDGSGQTKIRRWLFLVDQMKMLHKFHTLYAFFFFKFKINWYLLFYAVDDTILIEKRKIMALKCIEFGI